MSFGSGWFCGCSNFVLNQTQEAKNEILRCDEFGRVLVARRGSQRKVFTARTGAYFQQSDPVEQYDCCGRVNATYSMHPIPAVNVVSLPLAKSWPRSYFG